MYFICKQCQLPLSVPVIRVDDSVELHCKDNEPMLQRGEYTTGSHVAGPWSGVLPTSYVLNKLDLINTKSGGISNGCCGPDGMDGPNLECLNGHSIGTEKG